MFESLLDEALDAWADARNGVAAELENIPAERFTFRPVPEMRTVTGLAHHILEVPLMMVGELSRPDTNLRRAPFPELLRMYSGSIYSLESKEALLDALRRTLDEGCQTFREVGELHMLQTIIRFDGVPGTRLAWLHHGIEHEMYHRGQLALYARLMGIKPALTQRIEDRS